MVVKNEHLLPASDHIGVRLRQLRELRKLSQKELAERLGVDRTLIAAFETRQRGDQVSFGTVLRWADALSVTLEAFRWQRVVDWRELVPHEWPPSQRSG